MIRKSFAPRRVPSLPPRTRNGVCRTLACTVIVLVAGVILSAQGVAESANAASKRVPNCSTSEVKERVSTSKQSYGPGSSVVMTSSVRNASSETCNVAVGPTSPSLTITNAKGDVVWNNCYANDRPGVCALYLVVHTLKPGVTYTRTFEWDQRSGSPPARVPTGFYRLTARFSGVSGNHKTGFQLTKVAHVSSER